jgi:group I intron endonuclease
MKKEYHYVYLTTNNLTNQQYIGDRTTYIEPEKDNYFGSGVEIKNALKQQGRKNFTKIILEQCNTRKEAGNKQEYYIKLYKTHISQGGYNVNWNGGTCNGDRKHSEEAKKKMQKSHKKFSNETIKKMSQSHKGIKLSEEIKNKISLSLKGNKNPNFGKETWMKGKKHTEKSLKKLSESHRGQIPWNLGIPFSSEVKKKISASLSKENHPNWQKHLKVETRKKISELQKGKKRGKYNKLKLS